MESTEHLIRWQDQRDWPVLTAYLLLVDLGLLIYWVIAMGDLLPAEWLFKGYHDPVVSAWNWSFLPLDLLASFTGLAGIWTLRRGQRRAGECLLMVSLTLCFCAGLMALSFWTLTDDFDCIWWAFNAMLMGPSAGFLAWRLCCVRSRAAKEPAGVNQGSSALTHEGFPASDLPG
jgi:hypothetical protein